MWISILTLLLAAVALSAAGMLWLTYRRRAARQFYQRRLEAALADGMLTPEEVAELDGIRAARELTQAEVRMVARAIYRRALREALQDSRLSLEEDAALRQLQMQLGLSEADLGRDVVQLSRLRMLARIEAGDLPVVESPVPLGPHEHAHWVVQCTLADELDLPRSARTQLRGVRLETEGDTPFRADTGRSPLRSNERILPIDIGVLVISSRRTLFRGAKRSLTVPHARLDALALYGDGLRLDEVGGAVRGHLIVDDAELTAAVLLQAARRRRAEIRPTRSNRTA